MPVMYRCTATGVQYSVPIRAYLRGGGGAGGGRCVQTSLIYKQTHSYYVTQFYISLIYDTHFDTLFDTHLDTCLLFRF